MTEAIRKQGKERKTKEENEEKHTKETPYQNM